MTNQKIADLTGAILIAIAVCVLAPILPQALDFIAVRIRQDFFRHVPPTEVRGLE
ncbi:MAG: hypothetical protein KME10_19050 [Plectolyngbya sp. WJT66-NPBG17]|nr:hypothetical protein [Plectolyngbya sp. WJT66-NPBG17]